MILTDQISLPDCLYFVRHWSYMGIVIVFFTGCDVINFEINLIFLIKPFFLRDQTVKTKIEYLENEKSF